jgi:hypothetical protein
MMETIVLTRTGKPSLTFQGRPLGFVSSENKETPQKFERWYEISLYETTQQDYIARVAYCSTWPSEQIRYSGAAVESIQAQTLTLLFEALASYDPCKYPLLRPENNEEEIRRNAKRNFSAKQALIQSFQELTQKAADAIHYQEVSDTKVRNSQTLLQVWVENDLLSAIEKKRGTRTLEDITNEALRAWSLAQE